MDIVTKFCYAKQKQKKKLKQSKQKMLIQTKNVN